MAEKVTREQFIEWCHGFVPHAKRAGDGFTLNGKFLVAKECYCGGDNCHGWAMVKPDEEPIGNRPKAPVIELAKAKVVELPKPSPGNGAREALIEYFDGEHYLRHVLTSAATVSQLNKTDHLLAWMWERGFKVMLIEQFVTDSVIDQFFFDEFEEMGWDSTKVDPLRDKIKAAIAQLGTK